MRADRFLNLVQHFVMERLDESGQKDFRNALDRAERYEETPGQPARRKKVPSWWRGDIVAAETTVRAASQLGVAPVPEGATT